MRQQSRLNGRMVDSTVTVHSSSGIVVVVVGTVVVVVGIVVVVVGGTWVMVNVASQFSGGSATSSGSLTLIEHWLEGASPCTVMLRSAVTSVAPMFMVLELMEIYCAQVVSTSITSLSSSVGVSSMTSDLMKVTITSRVSSLPIP